MKEYEVWMRSHPWHGDKRQIIHVIAENDAEAIERAFNAMVWEEGPGARSRWFVYLSLPSNQERGAQPAEEVRRKWRDGVPAEQLLEGSSSVVDADPGCSTALILLKQALPLLKHNPGHQRPCPACDLEKDIVAYLAHR